MKSSRLFRCSNEKGYFAVSEKCSDFCQVCRSAYIYMRTTYWFFFVFFAIFSALNCVQSTNPRNCPTCFVIAYMCGKHVF